MTCVSETSPLTANAVIAAIIDGQDRVRNKNLTLNTSTEKLAQRFIASYIAFYMSVRNNPNNKKDFVNHGDRCLHIRLMISSATTLIAIAKILATKTDQDYVTECFKIEQRKMCAKTGNLCSDMLADIERKHLPTPLQFRSSVLAYTLPSIIHKRLRQAKDITKRDRRVDPTSIILKSIPVGTTVRALQYLIDVPLDVPAKEIMHALNALVVVPSTPSPKLAITVPKALVIGARLPPRLRYNKAALLTPGFAA